MEYPLKDNTVSVRIRYLMQKHLQCKKPQPSKVESYIATWK